MREGVWRQFDGFVATGMTEKCRTVCENERAGCFSRMSFRLSGLTDLGHSVNEPGFFANLGQGGPCTAVCEEMTDCQISGVVKSVIWNRVFANRGSGIEARRFAKYGIGPTLMKLLDLPIEAAQVWRFQRWEIGRFAKLTEGRLSH